MIQALLLLAAFLPASTTAPAQDDSPHREFDFWIGEWSVQNRHFRNGQWVDTDVTRARITPVCGKRAILEEWTGVLHGAFMNGFSLRAYDPGREDWALLLSWTTDGNSTFGRLRGRFRHGRGEFFSSWTDSQGPVTQRYSFSDGLPNTVRWDSAMTRDGGASWATDWIMEFSRTRAAEEVTQDRLFDVAWTEGIVSPHAQARALDWLVGEWKGIETDVESGTEREARLRCKLLNKGCLVLDVLATRASAGADWQESLAIRGFVPATQRWEAWSLTETDTRMRQAFGTPTDGVAHFAQTLPDGARRWETWRKLEEDAVVLEVEEAAPGSEDPQLVRVVELQRSSK